MILLRSCIIYEKSTPQKVASQKNLRVKIKTFKGDKFKLNFIELSDIGITSIQKTKRAFIKKCDIERIKSANPEPQIVPLEMALNHKGSISILTNDCGEIQPHETYKYNFEFFKFPMQGNIERDID